MKWDVNANSVYYVAIFRGSNTTDSFTISRQSQLLLLLWYLASLFFPIYQLFILTPILQNPAPPILMNTIIKRPHLLKLIFSAHRRFFQSIDKEFLSLLVCPLSKEPLRSVMRTSLYIIILIVLTIQVWSWYPRISMW